MASFSEINCQALEALETHCNNFVECEGFTEQMFADKGIERGVFFWPGGTSREHNIICMAPPFTIDEEELIRMVVVLEEVIAEIYQ